MTEEFKDYSKPNPTADARIAEQLTDGEEVVWAARPLVRLRLRKTILPFLLGLPITTVGFLFVRQFVGGPLAGGDTEILPFLDVAIRIVMGAAALLVGLIGVALVIYPLIEYRETKRELFALTSRRCLVWCRTDSGFGVKDLGPDEVRDMYRDIDARGRGNLILGRDTGPEGGTAEPEEDLDEVGFRGIQNVREVERLVRETLFGGTTGPVER